MWWEKLFVLLCIIPFAIGGIVVAGMMYKSFYKYLQRHSLYSSLCTSGGFVNISHETIAVEELTEKVFDMRNKCLLDTEDTQLSKILMKKEEDTTMYLTEMYHHTIEGKSLSPEQTVLLINLSLPIKNTYLIWEKRYREIEKTGNQKEILPAPAFLKRMSQKIQDDHKKREENPVKDLSVLFSENFDAYTLEGPDEEVLLNNDIQQFLLNHKGKYPFIDCVDKMLLFDSPLPGGGTIIISSGSICISARHTSHAEHLTNLFNLSNGLMERIVKRT